MHRIFLTGLCATLLLADPVTFDVASVKARPEIVGNPGPEEMSAHPGSVRMRNVRLASAVIWAYELKLYQLACPNWVWNARYDISAKASDGTEVSVLRQMMQTLLSERLRLVSHRETKSMKCYLLTVGKDGPKLHETAAEKFGVEGDRFTHFLFKRISLAHFAEILWEPFQTPMFDETGLTGFYDIGYDLTPYLEKGRTTYDDQVAALFPAFREHLGLGFERTERPVERLVVDSVDKTPSEN